MKPPLIGLTTRSTAHPEYGWPMVSSPRSYTEALLRAGAQPLLIPLNTPLDSIEPLLNRLDGILLTGGGDIATDRFSGQPHPRVYGIDEERDAFEISLVQALTRRRLPFLAICRGCQVLNVALGGTLYTHISDQLPGALEHACHPAFPTDHLAHLVDLEPGSQLALIFTASQVQVNSLHHQGIETLASALQIEGRAPDGLIEAVSLLEHPFGLAVQWHPEWMPADPAMRSLFSAFTVAAGARQ
jgi:putative glutamine amidotransferase